MALGKKRGAIEKWSGGIMEIKEVNSDGSDLTVADTWKEMPYIKNGKYSSQQPGEKVPDETGKTIVKIFNEKEVMITGNWLQVDKDLQDFQEETVTDKFYAVYIYQGIVNGYHKEIYCPICQFTPMYEDEAGTRQPAFEIEVLSNDDEITIDAAALPTNAQGAGDVVIAAGTFREVVETAVA